jgi:hypothetical protein
MTLEDLFEFDKQVRRMDFIRDMMSANIKGFIEGFADSYGKALTHRGMDKQTVRQMVIGGLCRYGFEESEVAGIIHLEPGEWNKITPMYPVDMEWRKAYRDKLYKSALDDCNEFERTHPDYFNKSSMIQVVATTKKH